MRSLPLAVVRAALAQGLEVHNYYASASYAEVFIPERVAGCMARGQSKKVKAFLAQVRAEASKLPDGDLLVVDLEIHHLGKVPRLGAMMAICFPDWQFEPEGDA